MRINKLTQTSTKDILTTLLKRSTNDYDEYQNTVNEIVKNVRQNGDDAMLSYTKQFDNVQIAKDELLVTKDEIEKAYELIDTKLLEVIKKAIVNIRAYHEKQLKNS